MEIFLIIVLIVIAIVGFMFIKFSMFKSRLMNAFGRHGLPYTLADDIYTQYSKRIHKLHAEGFTPEQIATHIIEELDNILD
ncbi:MAG: hypothetical protein P8N97_08775 [Alphaproteobacteria bacterium]|nr:hypothetical protein [Alphaproteobacteria bacterium]